jgi:alanine dehydrogenase
MTPGSVFVDIAIDQGGCAETSKPTTHDKPTYVVDNVVHYCVANMPGAVPLTSALALNHSVLPYALALASKGWKAALAEIPGFLPGLNVCKGEITHKAVAEALGPSLCGQAQGAGGVKSLKKVIAFGRLRH